MTAFDDATSATEKARREALDAMARGGSAGVDAYKQAQSQVTGYRDQALNQALSGAADRGASSAAQSELATTIRQPGDRTLQNLAAAQGTFSADMARQGAANDSYFAEAKAAVPAIQAASNRDISWARQQWEQSKAKEQAASDKATNDAKWQQEAITKGLAEMQAEADRTRRFNDIQEQQARVAAPVSNPTYDPVGAALLLASGGGTPQQQAVAHQAIANPSAGATYRAPSGAVVPMTPTVADPHYMGHLLPDAAHSIAQEIAATKVPSDVQAQRDAYMQVYGNDPRTTALAYGMFQPPTPVKQAEQDLTAQKLAAQTEFINQYGVAPTPTQVQLFQQGIDPFAANATKPRISPAEAAAQVSHDPEKLLSQTYVGSEDGKTYSVYDVLAGEFTDYLKQGYTPQQAAERVRHDIERPPEEGGLGRDYPGLRQVLVAVYGGS